MSKIRPRRMTDREAMWARYGLAIGFQTAAQEAKRVALENQVPSGGLLPTLARDLHEDAMNNLRASRRASRLRLRGSP